jgi:metal-dependent amidase/aminoacylase/carboxypeptidase family protein
MEEDKKLKRKVAKNIDSIKESLIQIARTIHKDPELGFKEYKACSLLTSELARHGFEIEKGIAGMCCVA